MSALRKLAATAAVLASVHSAEAMTYQHTIEKGRLKIWAMGDIELDEPARFLDFTDRLPPHLFALLYGNATIVLESPGGNLQAAFVLANILSGYHMTTSVPDGGQCASACVVIWAAGARRTVPADARIGVHSCSFDGTATQNSDPGGARRAERYYTGVMAGWLRRNGAPDNVAAKTIETPADSMYWLTPDDLKAWKVKVTP